MIVQQSLLVLLTHAQRCLEVADICRVACIKQPAAGLAQHLHGLVSQLR